VKKDKSVHQQTGNLKRPSILLVKPMIMEEKKKKQRNHHGENAHVMKRRRGPKELVRRRENREGGMGKAKGLKQSTMNHHKKSKNHTCIISSQLNFWV